MAGVDGARGGWVIAVAEPGGMINLRFDDTLATVVAHLRAGVVDAAVIDMPIGLSHNGVRPVDALVRSRLGPRRSTFFPTPIRAVLDEASWAEANKRSKSIAGTGLSKQAWNLVPKIREVDGAWSDELKAKLFEGHPETSFAEMANEPVMSKKSSPEGRAERLALLTRVLSSSVDEVVETCPNAWRIDAIDALALAWTALRVASGSHTLLGGELDRLGRPMRLAI